jgi:hypothetical protein
LLKHRLKSRGENFHNSRVDLSKNFVSLYTCNILHSCCEKKKLNYARPGKFLIHLAVANNVARMYLKYISKFPPCSSLTSKISMKILALNFFFCHFYHAFVVFAEKWRDFSVDGIICTLFTDFSNGKLDNLKM